tara:strand:+ start:75630 stop:76127 length:498 start_codon:yes stop_codon:yes gene_type:complete
MSKYTIYYFLYFYFKQLKNQNIMTTTNKPTAVFWIIAVIAVIWNGLGAMAYVAQQSITQEELDMLPEAESALYNDIPVWATSAFAIAVWAGLLGSLLLIFRKKWAKPVFLVSLVGILVQMVYNLFLSGAMDVYGPGGMIMPIMVVVIGFFLVWYSHKAIAKGWLK